MIEPASQTEPQPTSTSVYHRLGVRSVINGRGATTNVGGSLMRPEVLAVMADAARSFVVLDELNGAVSERIAAITGADAAHVTSGSAAGMALSAAACIAGTDPEAIRRLPASDGRPNEIVIHRTHRINYDQMFRVGGGHLIEIGLASGTEAWELERAISERTAAVAWTDSPAAGTGALDFDRVVDISRARGKPVIVDAASTLPPVDHLRRWIRCGADLVIYSGGKGIRGPQDSGFVVGRADLIAAVAANASPRAGVGRGMKVSKEAIAGLWEALQLFLETDHEAEHAVHEAEAGLLAGALHGRNDAWCVVERDWDRWPAPVVRVFPVNGCWKPATVRDALLAGDPAIAIFAEHEGLMVSTHCLLPGDVERIIPRLRAELDAARGRAR